MTMDDERLIQEAYQRLVDTYLASPHRKKVSVIEKAFRFACQAHHGVRRLSGEPYIMHPLAVAQIVCGEIGLGSTSICAALLHDVVEDRPQGTLLKKAYINTAVAEAHAGIKYAAAVKTALPMVVFE